MPVERKGDGSIAIRDNNGITVIGRITAASDEKREQNFKQWVEECSQLITACSHTLRETEEYFLTLCDALPLSIEDRRMKNFQLNVIMNHYKDKLVNQTSAEFSFEMTDEEIEKWLKEQNAIRDEALNSSPELFGLDLRGYYLPHTERNEIFYEEARLEMQKSMKHTQPEQIELQDICFFFEETTGHCQSDGGKNLMNELIVFRGVSQADIETRSPQFLAYITALREIENMHHSMGE